MRARPCSSITAEAKSPTKLAESGIFVHVLYAGLYLFRWVLFLAEKSFGVVILVIIPFLENPKYNFTFLVTKLGAVFLVCCRKHVGFYTFIFINLFINICLYCFSNFIFAMFQLDFENFCVFVKIC